MASVAGMDYANAIGTAASSQEPAQAVAGADGGSTRQAGTERSSSCCCATHTAGAALLLLCCCHSDLHPYHEREKGLLPGTIVGHEFTGVVEECGSQVRGHVRCCAVRSPHANCRHFWLCTPASSAQQLWCFHDMVCQSVPNWPHCVLPCHSPGVAMRAGVPCVGCLQVQHLRPGDKVMSPFTTNCGSCFFCTKGGSVQLNRSAKCRVQTPAPHKGQAEVASPDLMSASNRTSTLVGSWMTHVCAHYPSVLAVVAGITCRCSHPEGARCFGWVSQPAAAAGGAAAAAPVGAQGSQAQFVRVPLAEGTLVKVRREQTSSWRCWGPQPGVELKHCWQHLVFRTAHDSRLSQRPLAWDPNRERQPMLSSAIIPSQPPHVLALFLAQVPEGVTDEEAILLGDILSTAFFCVDQGAVSAGDTVVVLGCGPVGLLAVLAARQRGAGQVGVSVCCSGRLRQAMLWAAAPGADLWAKQFKQCWATGAWGRHAHCGRHSQLL